MNTPKNTSKTIFKIRLKVGDTVVVRSGKYKGDTGKITAVHPTENKVTVEGINVVKKHQKPNNAHPQGGIIEITKPIWVSKVGILEPTAKKATRVAFKLDKDGNKVRVFASTKKEIK
jgi:large subunit ribosomal protein L24